MFQKTNIPEDFYSYESKKPFEHCIECGSDLVQSQAPYFVEKAFRKYPKYKVHDVVYEFAMCFTCANEMRQTLSVESTRALQQFMEGSMGKNPHNLHPPNQKTTWFKNCFVTQQPIQDQEEYIIYGVFQGDQMMVADFPYAIGLDAMNQLSELLSNKTLDIMDDFMGDHFTGPPEVNELLKPRMPVLI